MRCNPSNLLVRTFGVRTWCKWALKSDSPWLMWTRIPYSAKIGLPVRYYIIGAAEAARKPNMQPRTETDGKKRKKNARNATEFLNSVDLGKVWPPLSSTSLEQRVRVDINKRHTDFSAHLHYVRTPKVRIYKIDGLYC